MLTTGPNGEGLVYFIMEFIPGATLSELIRREAPLSPERALSITLQVADALSASHKAQIVHRDLKPDNIILVQRGREKDFVKLLDFGIAKLTGDQPGSRRTRTGLVMGTPAYMSPEQCEGSNNVDHRTDIYALGIVLYEMITGRVPFYGEGYGEVLVQHLTQPPAPPSTIRGLIPPHVEQVILKALEKRPEMRFPTMDEMSKSLMDPVGYVEAHGGIAGFLGHNIIPSNDPVAPVSRMTPSAISSLTPVPGSVTTPTTLGGSTGQLGGGQSGQQDRHVHRHRHRGRRGRRGRDRPAAGRRRGRQQDRRRRGRDRPGHRDRHRGRDRQGDQRRHRSRHRRGHRGRDCRGTAAGTAEGTGAGTAEGTGAGTAEGTGAGTGEGTAAGTGQGTAAGTGAGTSVDVAAEEITITVSSTPKGAFVTFGDDTVPKGRTPITFKVPKSDSVVVIDIELPGYHDQEKKVKLTGDVDLEVALKKRSGGTGTGTSKGTGKGTGKPKCTDADLMDPFADCK